MRTTTNVWLFSVISVISSVNSAMGQTVTASPNITTAGAIPIGTGNVNQVTQDSTFTWITGSKQLNVPVGFTLFVGGERFLSMYPNQGHTSANMFIGLSSGNLTNEGYNNVALGINSLGSLSSGAGNVAIGHDTLDYVTNGDNNTAVGYKTLENTTGNDNTSIGWSGAHNLTSGSAVTAIGYSALYDVTTASDDTAVGFKAMANATTGANNVAIGANTAPNTESGSSNTFVGTGAGASSDVSNSGAFGSNAQATKSHQIALGTSAEEVYAPGHFNSPTYEVSGTAGLSRTVTVVGKTGGTCNLVFSSGILTSTTCP